MRVVVVGAGLGGLSAACHLAGAGHEVVVVEREPVPGGRAGVLDEAGFRIDTGPSVLTMTGILARTFAAAGAEMADHLTVRPVDPMYRACFPDGSELRVRHGVDAMAAEIRRVCGTAEAAAFERFCRWLRELYDVELRHFIDRNFDSPADLARQPGALIRLIRLGALRHLAPVVASYSRDLPGSSSCSRSRPCTRVSRRSRRSRCTASSRTWTPSKVCTSRRAGSTRSRARWRRWPRR